MKASRFATFAAQWETLMSKASEFAEQLLRRSDWLEFLEFNRVVFRPDGCIVRMMVVPKPTGRVSYANVYMESGELLLVRKPLGDRRSRVFVA